ncbi:hypothetical protein BYT27DRAFT_7181509 [Phlegmacium glaucopus]|nr:hypothetical protein BYT27DRAFT_7181509 [Phlegmacium glaucopus]
MVSLVVQVTRIDYGRTCLETIFEEEETSTSPAIDKQAAMSVKQYVLTLLQSLRRKRMQAPSL